MKKAAAHFELIMITIGFREEFPKLNAAKIALTSRSFLKNLVLFFERSTVKVWKRKGPQVSKKTISIAISMRMTCHM